jgi:hypothetical protein
MAASNSAAIRTKGFIAWISVTGFWIPVSDQKPEANACGFWD